MQATPVTPVKLSKLRLILSATRAEREQRHFTRNWLLLFKPMMIMLLFLLLSFVLVLFVVGLCLLHSSAYSASFPSLGLVFRTD
eukprot:m.315462 g.315462  ORF g.315462 m.315462 type:complete len:84 (-) comp55439_c0_seq12:690-941(-)